MVRCADCGFLAARVLATRALVEAEPAMREDWLSALPPHKGDEVYATRPLCFAMAADLGKEIDQYLKETPGVTNQACYKTILHGNRRCEQFTPWRQGFTPREHREMLDHKELLQAQAEQRVRDKQWQAEQREKDRQFQSEQRKDDRRWQQAQNWWNRIFTIGGVVLGAILGAVLAYIFGIKK